MACKLLGGAYAIFLQIFIGVAALCSLLFKREYMDKEPKRPYLIWLMDVSKQGIAESTLHVYNVAFGIIIDNMFTEESNDQCAIYLMNETMDTVLGTAFVYLFSRLFEYIGRVYDIKELENTGYYGSPPQLRHYILQLGCFMASNFIGKLLVTIICLSDPRSIESVGSFIFRETGTSDDLELTMVMVVLPLLMTVAQVWIVDTFLGFDTEQDFAAFHYRELSEPLHDTANASDARSHGAMDAHGFKGSGGVIVRNSAMGGPPITYTPPQALRQVSVEDRLSSL
jgi:hypothetical protein